MNEIKLETDQDYLSYDSCFICLHLLPLSFETEEQLNSTGLFFKYLKIRDEVKASVCAKCEENLTKFVKLYNTLEKVRLEMDYLLDSIKGTILNSNISKPANVRNGVDSARRMVVEKSLAKMKSRKPHVLLERLDISRIKKESNPIPFSDLLNPLPNFDTESNDADDNINYEATSPLSTYIRENRRPQIILERLDISKFIKKESKLQASDCSDEWCPNLDDVSNSSDQATPLSPVISKIIDIKPKVNLEKSAFKKKTSALKTQKATCTKCSKIFRNKYSLKNHYDAVHLHLKPFKCPTCLKPFFNRGNMKDHINSVHFRRHKCDICDKSFAKFSQLRLHKIKPHLTKLQAPNSEMLSCKICEKIFNWRSNLRQHMSYVHSEKRFQCSICKKQFTTYADLRRHNSTVHEKKKHHCEAPGCDKSYSRRDLLNNHYKLDHLDFTNPSTQQRTRLKYEKVTCPQCPKIVTRKTLKHHIDTVHLHLKPFKCSTCLKEFTLKSTLRKHINGIHLRLRPFKCDKCDKPFANTFNLNRHKARCRNHSQRLTSF